ncbi:MAG: hypothetical protein Q7K39_03185 [Candidatus Magasanikbacteria bacterium]|nr:hypothetical protein [Candidatus Magasanikbacteria bacterium]
MEPTIIGVKKLYRDLHGIARATARGQSFTVVKYSKPIFRIEPVATPNRKKYTLNDLFAIRFKGGDPNLSKNIDKIVYGV